MWFAWKFLSLWYQTQLCNLRNRSPSVVICLKISIFVVSNTTSIRKSISIIWLWFAWKFLSLWYQTQPSTKNIWQTLCCDLLENFYLCGIKHNAISIRSLFISVVICLKISIFVVSNTTDVRIYDKSKWLWFAWKFLSLWYQTQLCAVCLSPLLGCDLLENFYLCGIKHNWGAI